MKNAPFYPLGNSLDIAWFESDKDSFLSMSTQQVVERLSSAAVKLGWAVEPEQHEEWDASVQMLQRDLDENADESVRVLKSALQKTGLGLVTDVVLEYNFKRRGLRLDCVLLCPGVIFVIEFKRSKIEAVDRIQVQNYCVNLIEFHEVTQRCCENGARIIPIVVCTASKVRKQTRTVFHKSPWNAMLNKPMECGKDDLGECLQVGLGLAQNDTVISRREWIASKFSPSSTIVDAAISLYGNHDVSAIDAHAAPVEKINKCFENVEAETIDALHNKTRRIIFVSGSPGAGKTLVGLKLAFSPHLRENAVFVTGNAPLVDVLNESLKKAYRKAKNQGTVTGYAREHVRELIANTDFKIVKAHNYLGNRSSQLDSAAENIVIFDEAQRTYAKGKVVLRQRLVDHEADLILTSLEESFDGGAVVIALIGHNQTINTGEQGAVAWIHAAKRRGWDISISEETLALSEFLECRDEAIAFRRLAHGHLSQSMRFYRNQSMEAWTDHLLEEQPNKCLEIARELDEKDLSIRLTRDLDTAKSWARQQCEVHGQAGIIASAQGRRLAAYGLHVGYKPSIADWILADYNDIRSCNMLETVQNQYQIQGLEIDYTIVAWDADLRRENDQWKSYKISGSKWTNDKALQIAKSGYRVLLTRARKGIVIFVPEGSANDKTRSPEFYDSIYEYLRRCGAQTI